MHAYPKLSFVDLKTQLQRIRPEVEAAMLRVLDHGAFVMGPEVFDFERDLCAFTGSKHVLSCSNGTDALALILRTYGIGPSDAVLLPSFTFAATAEVICWLGATPVFLDVLESTYQLDPSQISAGAALARSHGLCPKAVIAVDLFGQPADYDAIGREARAEGLEVIADAAQSVGASYRGRSVGTLARMSATSFFPSKPLGCYGDGGAVFVQEDSDLECLKSLRVHGQGADKYENVRVGMNARLDSLQAAILIEKLKIFPNDLAMRQRVANFYHEALQDTSLGLPQLLDGTTSSWAQYTVTLPDAQTRHRVMSALDQKGIPTVIYYPKPLHQQEAFAEALRVSPTLKISESLSERVLSLPMGTHLEPSTLAWIVQQLISAL